MRLSLLSLASLALVVLPLVAAGLSPFSSSGVAAMTFCKCLCFSNSTILPLYLPKDPLHPCLTCTRQFCLDQKLPACIGAKSGDEDLDTGTGEGGDVEARCFQRDSPKSHFIVVAFIVITSSLLFGAGLKHAGVDIQQMWERGGIRGVVSDLIELLRSFNARRGRGPTYASMPS